MSSIKKFRRLMTRLKDSTMPKFEIIHYAPEELAGQSDIIDDYTDLYEYKNILEEYIRNYCISKMFICPECGKPFPAGQSCKCGHKAQTDRAYRIIIDFKWDKTTVSLFNMTVHDRSLDYIFDYIPWFEIHDYIVKYNIKYNIKGYGKVVPTIEQLKEFYIDLTVHINEYRCTGVSSGGFIITTDIDHTFYTVEFKIEPELYK